MIIISKVHKGNIAVKEDTTISGILVGNADIHEGSQLHIGGIMNGDIIDDGGEIIVTGMHNGKRV
jgi:hypothetical protein